MGTRYNGTPDERRALDAYIKLQRAAHTTAARTGAHLARYDLTDSQFGVLEALYHLGTLSQRQLADKLLTSTGNMTMVLKNLERRGLVTRERDARDNRYMRVCITETGQALICQVLPEHVRGIVEELGILSPAEQDELGRLCRKLGLRQG